jgi:prevent-host-death family protein
MPSKVARKTSALTVIPGAISATEAREKLGALLNRARFGSERIPITERGEVKAAIIGPEDLKLLEQVKPSAAPSLQSDATSRASTVGGL